MSSKDRTNRGWFATQLPGQPFENREKSVRPQARAARAADRSPPGGTVVSRSWISVRDHAPVGNEGTICETCQVRVLASGLSTADAVLLAAGNVTS